MPKGTYGLMYSSQRFVDLLRGICGGGEGQIYKDEQEGDRNSQCPLKAREGIQESQTYK